MASGALPPVCILAGGHGRRLGDLTREVPKPMLPIAGRPFIEHQLELLAAHGARKVVLAVAYRAEAIEALVGNGARFGLEIEYVHDGPRPMGTAAAIRRALPVLGNEFMVLYGDTYLRIDYADVARAFCDSPLPALLTVLHNRGAWGTSNAVYRDNRVVAYDKRTAPLGAEWIDYGLSVFSATPLEVETSDDLADVFHALAREGALAGYPATERFYEIGTPDAAREAEAFLARR
jgi:NDP-sugar pyrophosphorylase family protein